MAESKNHNEFYDMTFSQREGEAPLPDPMQLEHIPKKFRQIVHMAIEREISVSRDYDYDRRHAHSDSTSIKKILFSYRFNVRGQYSDEIPSSRDSDISLCRRCVKDGEYHKVLTLIEYILRRKCSESLHRNLMLAFDHTPVAYFVEEINGLPTILPRASQEAGEATQQAFETLRAAGMGGATTHLRQAAEHINAKQFAHSVRDSISAVESVARQIAPGASTLDKALKVLEKNRLLTNPQLKAGFEQLYHYTNSEQGIRHALIDKDSPDVGLDEAVFMFGACASFAAYLASKHRQTK